MKEDAAAIGAKYVIALGEPNGFGGYQQYGPSVGIKVRLYDAVSGEYRGWADNSYPNFLARLFQPRADQGWVTHRRGLRQPIGPHAAPALRAGVPLPVQEFRVVATAEPRDTYGR